MELSSLVVPTKKTEGADEEDFKEFLRLTFFADHRLSLPPGEHGLLHRRRIPFILGRGGHILRPRWVAQKA